jgi:hypothetical protein
MLYLLFEDSGHKFICTHEDVHMDGELYWQMSLDCPLCVCSMHSGSLL